MKKNKQFVCASYTDDEGKKVCLEGKLLRRNKNFFLVEVFKKIESLGEKIISISFSSRRREKIFFRFKDFLFKEINRQPFNPSIEGWDDGEY